MVPGESLNVARGRVGQLLAHLGLLVQVAYRRRDVLGIPGLDEHRSAEFQRNVRLSGHPTDDRGTRAAAASSSLNGDVPFEDSGPSVRNANAKLARPSSRATVSGGCQPSHATRSDCAASTSAAIAPSPTIFNDSPSGQAALRTAPNNESTPCHVARLPTKIA